MCVCVKIPSSLFALFFFSIYMYVAYLNFKLLKICSAVHAFVIQKLESTYYYCTVARMYMCIVQFTVCVLRHKDCLAINETQQNNNVNHAANNAI